MTGAGKGLCCRGAGLYIRLSREDERDGPSQSVENQQALLERYAREHRLRVYNIYIDDGWSGTNFDRPGFRRLLADIEQGYVDLVITKDLSRLGRDYILTGHYMERYFPEHGVRYISLLDGIDTGVESSANDITPFRAIMNDMYAKDISKKIRAVKREQQRRGQFVGGKPVYGYKMHPTEKNRIVIDEGAAPTVRKIFAMALSGMSCRQIALELNAAGEPTPARYAGLPLADTVRCTGLWSSERISELLQNETYLGNMVQGRSARVSYKSKRSVKRPREDWVVVEGTHPPLVSREQFLQVERLLESRRHTRQRRYDFLLKGMIFCRECGSPLGVVNRKNAAGEDVLYLICRGYQRYGRTYCSAHTVKERTVAAAVQQRLAQLCAGALCHQNLFPAALRWFREHGGSAAREKTMQNLARRLAALERQTDLLCRERLSGAVEAEDFSRLYAALCRERKDLAAQRTQLAAEPVTSPEAAAARGVAGFLAGALESRQVLTALLERVELTAEKEILLHLRFGKKEEIS